jgi:aspartate aminotransferase-like enzyme
MLVVQKELSTVVLSVDYLVAQLADTMVVLLVVATVASMGISMADRSEFWMVVELD